MVFDYQERSRQVIEEHGGGVANFAGDGLVATFGHPVAHENDAERAADAGLALVAAVEDMHRTHGVELRCRVGVHADVAVVGRMGDRHDVSLFGAAINIAAHVQTAAGVGEVLVTDAVLSLLRGSHITTDHRRVELKGVAEPVGVARLVGPVPFRDRRRHLGMVGRHDERAELAMRRREAVARGGAIVICGPAGIGKSTLLADLLAQEEPGWIEVRARELAGLTPFAPLTDLAAEVATSAPAGSRLSVAAAELAQRIASTTDTAGSAEHSWQLVIEASRELGSRPRRSSRRRRGCPLAGRLDPRRPRRPGGRTPRGVLVPRGHDAATVAVRGGAGARAGSARRRRRGGTGDRRDGRIRRGRGRPGDARGDRRQGRGHPALRRRAGPRRRVAGGHGTLPHSLHGSLLARLDRAPALAAPARAASVLGDEVDTGLLAAVLGVDQATAATTVSTTSSRARSCVVTRPTRPRSSTPCSARRSTAPCCSASAGTCTPGWPRPSRADGGRDDDRAVLCGHHLEHAGDRRGAADVLRRRRPVAAPDAGRSPRRWRWPIEVSPSSARTTMRRSPSRLTMTKGNARLAVEGYAAPGLGGPVAGRRARSPRRPVTPPSCRRP